MALAAFRQHCSLDRYAICGQIAYLVTPKPPHESRRHEKRHFERGRGVRERVHEHEVLCPFLAFKRRTHGLGC